MSLSLAMILVLSIHPKTNLSFICSIMKTQLVVKQFIKVAFRELHKFSYHSFLKAIFFYFRIHVTVSNIFYT